MSRSAHAQYQRKTTGAGLEMSANTPIGNTPIDFLIMLVKPEQE